MSTFFILNMGGLIVVLGTIGIGSICLAGRAKKNS